MTSFGIRTLKKFLSCPYAGHAASGGIVTTLATRTIKTKVLIIPSPVLMSATHNFQKKLLRAAKNYRTFNKNYAQAKRLANVLKQNNQILS